MELFPAGKLVASNREHSFWTPVSVFPEPSAANLELLREQLANARGEHQLPYQHAAMPALAQQKWLPNGVASPNNWAHLLAAPDTLEWQASDKKEKCALVDLT
ncbi:hypothetical protein CYMTET_35241 [Cymbomonas tetramitiformis]|uniref:Uncharacterized protein n=1 Tax=Cymbomonas tetramitiformis TaxID=36881 RepID=A0AAE0F9J2_9CHLO|nr:hypothetical protein CYMTET_35241 [Cymbomonas tetramitiformis]